MTTRRMMYEKNKNIWNINEYKNTKGLTLKWRGEGLEVRFKFKEKKRINEKRVKEVQEMSFKYKESKKNIKSKWDKNN